MSVMQFACMKAEAFHFVRSVCERLKLHLNTAFRRLKLKKATLSDVASLAGVSIGTASKYINGKPVSSQNARRIQSAIDKLAYAPNALAQSFASGKTDTILLYTINEYPIKDSTWMYELPIIHGLTDVLQERGYNLKIELASVSESEANARKIDHYVRSKYVDGIILISPWEIPADLILPMEYHKLPYVAVGSESTGRREGFIDIDNAQPIHDIVHSMYRKGCRKFALIGGFKEHRHMMYREKGFRKALQELELPIRPEWICYGDYSLQSGFDHTKQFLASKDLPDAIVCGNDFIASGVIRACHEMGVAVPEKLMVSGFDDTAVSDATFPSITSVSVPAYDMGAIAGHELLRKLNSPDYSIPNQILSCTVREKGSTSR